MPRLETTFAYGGRSIAFAMVAMDRSYIDDEVDKAPVTEAATAFGLSRPAFYQAQHAVAQQGLAGLIPGKRGPHGSHKLTPGVLDFVLQQRAASPC